MLFVRATARRRRLILITLVGVGAPLLALAGFAAYQTRHLARFLSDASSDYGGYAATLTAKTLAFEVQRRVVEASADARLATSFAGASPDLLNLMQTGDPLLERPFLVPDDEILRVAEEEPDAPDNQIVAAAGFGLPRDSLSIRVTAPRSLWRALVGAVYDTIYVVPPLRGESPLVIVPLIGFQGRIVAAAGWELHTEALSRSYLDRLINARVFADPRVYHAERISKALALTVYDNQSREVYRSRPGTSGLLYAEAPIGSLLPGWRVSVGPSAGSPYVWARAFIVAAYLLLVLLVLLSVAALWAALRQASEEIQLAEAKTAFLANVSHELKTPLALIRMAGETLELGRVRSDEERQRFLKVIGRECRRLTHMINHVLDFAKIEAGRKEFRFQRTDLRKIVQETLEVFQPQFEEGKFEVAVDVPDTLPPIEADPEAVTQCLMNLLDNAVKYSKDRRSIEVKVRVTPPETDGNLGEARIQVADHGIGISARDRERIFDKFFRVDHGMVHDVKGSGLGLSLVRHIAEAHGGRMEVESTPGQGSRFVLVLPARQPHAAAPDGSIRERR
ncbi:MAG TPA: HAMP domain-containing sensor histidine kinase [Candidatus Eisenbacteria bacterium]|jgi:signal transduction histidine kinase|nr:HAMP domain-containing sensor histidine kinase [Candidatus Eisenbacteria bacterium]